MTKLDILVIAAHPDDAELAASGTIMAHVAQGKKVGVIDLTQGELGTRGTPELRIQEAEAAAAIMGLSTRENMGFRDGFFQDDEPHQMALITKIRQYQPKIILANAVEDRHPDHGKGAALARSAVFLAGLRKIETQLDGVPQEAWRPGALYHFIQSIYLEPDFVVDVSRYWERKIEAIRAYGSQFHNPTSDEPETYISRPQFMQMIEGRGVEYGNAIGVAYGEGFTKSRQLGVQSLSDLI